MPGGGKGMNISLDARCLRRVYMCAQKGTGQQCSAWPTVQSWPDADGAFLGLQNRLNGSESVLLGVHPPWAKKASAGLVCC